MRLAVPAPVLVALAVALAGCPIPQPLPDYPAGTITPPRILVDEIAASTDGKPVIFVPAGCVTTAAPVYPLSARVLDTNNNEAIGARWFVNYDHRDFYSRTILRDDDVPANPDPTDLVREVPPRTTGGAQQFFVFEPYQFRPALGAPDMGHSQPPFPEAGILRIVELVVSNGFDPNVVGTVPLSNRAPRLGFETQVHRWVFLSVPESPSVPCP